MKVGDGGPRRTALKVDQRSKGASEVGAPATEKMGTSQPIAKQGAAQKPGAGGLEVPLPPKTPAPEAAQAGFERREVGRGALGLLMAGHRPAVDGAMNAIKGGDVNALRTSIKAGGDVNAHDASGMTPLSLAAVRGNVDAMGALLMRRRGSMCRTRRAAASRSTWQPPAAASTR